MSMRCMVAFEAQSQKQYKLQGFACSTESLSMPGSYELFFSSGQALVWVIISCWVWFSQLVALIMGEFLHGRGDQGAVFLPQQDGIL